MIVLNQLPPTEKNALWNLFSGAPRQVRFGAGHYHWHRGDHSTITNQLDETYVQEGMIMPYTYEDFYRDWIDEHKDQLLKRVAPEDMLKYLSPEEIFKRFSVEERLKGLSPEEIETYLNTLREQHSSN